MADLASELGPGGIEVVLSLADDEHLMGQQYAEWIGVTPFLEEDLAFCSIGQDELGHAALLYAVVVGDDGSIDGEAAIDQLALQRAGEDYRSCWFTERPTDDWAEALVRHWLYDRAEQLRWAQFSSSTVAALADATVRVEREEVYHRRHGDGLLDVLLGDPDSGPRLQSAVRLWAPLALGMFEPVAGEGEALADGVIGGSVADLRAPWMDMVTDRFGPVEWGIAPAQEGRRLRSSWFDPLMSRMREVIDLDPLALW
ncbi:MAG: Phenylacetic acid catabolic protein [Actinomycetota bacterium]